MTVAKAKNAGAQFISSCHAVSENTFDVVLKRLDGVPESATNL